jgi:hypothetical protein
MDAKVEQEEEEEEGGGGGVTLFLGSLPVIIPIQYAADGKFPRVVDTGVNSSAKS